MRLTLFVTCLVVLLVQFDTTVVNLALHAIQTSLGGGVASLQGILDAYNVVYASMILTGGTLADLFGRRRLLATGIGIFAVASLACGLAPSAPLLVVFRALAGIGGALALPGSLAVLRVAYADARPRARAVSIWAAMNGVAVAAGPVIGGVLVDSLGWRSIFLVAVPLGGLALALTLAGVQESADPRGRRLDLLGQVLAIGGIGLLASGLIAGQTLGWLSAPLLAILAAALALLVVFLLVERRAASPLLPLDVFRQRALSGSLAVAAAMTFGMYGLLLLVPLYLQSVLGQSSAAAGLMLVPMGIVFAVVSSFAGGLATRFGPRLPIAAGMALAGLGLALIAETDRSAGPTMLQPGLVLIGVALGVQAGPLMAVAVANVAPERAGMASGLVNVGRMLGATLGVAVLGSIFAAVSHGAVDADAFTAGMRVALLVGAAVEGLGSLIALVAIRSDSLEAPPAPQAPAVGNRRHAVPRRRQYA